jgi:uncharacterized membrane protein YphA (DoxX/SURF4 family)
MKILAHFSRLIVSLTFIFSGFVKLVDPLGSAYKFEEYFSANVLNMEFLIPYALPFAILLILVEIMLGVTLLLGYLPKITVWGLAIIMLVFLFLTWYSAYYNKVSDCGCFGDAIKLSQWGTFYKNVVLMVLVIILLLKIELIKPIFSASVVKWLSFLSFVSFLYITYYVLIHLPIIDFRPFAIGKSITDGMSYEKHIEPPILDFYLESNDGEDKTEFVLKHKKVLLVVMNPLSKSDVDSFSTIKIATDEALKNNYIVYALSSSAYSEFETIKQANDWQFDMLFADATMLKTVVRANPGLVILSSGVIKDKRNWPDYHKLKFE